MATYTYKLSDIKKNSKTVYFDGGIEADMRIEVEEPESPLQLFVALRSYNEGEYDWNTTVIVNGSTSDGYWMNWYEIKPGSITLNVEWSGNFFDGVSTNYGSGSFTIIIENDLKYSVTYNGNGGTFGDNETEWTDTATIFYGGSYHVYDNSEWLNNPFVNPGYICTGWIDQYGNDWSSYTGDEITWNYTDDITLYAVWELEIYTITYNGNGGLFNGEETWEDPETVWIGAEYTVHDNFFTRPGYRFKGWIDQNGIDWTGDIGNPYIWNERYAYNVILYAQWEKITIKGYIFNGETFNTIVGVKVYDGTNFRNAVGVKNNK